MAHCVFIHRPDSIYNDHPTERYQFPRPYLSRCEGCVGDWITYLEPTKLRDTRGYFAVAKVQQIIADPSEPGMFIAIIEPRSYLPFEQNVPFSGPAGPVERGLLNEMGRLSGRAQSAIRPISQDDFNRIVEIGLPDRSSDLPRVSDPPARFEFSDIQMPLEYPEVARDRSMQLSNRILRDRVFRKIVLQAYDSRCAFTGLKLINGGGRAEVEAAHIRPVEMDGPDIVNNGIALSGTAHWMFDRGLLSIGDDCEILFSSKINDIDSVRTLINSSGRTLLPGRPSEMPNPRFLRWHRENIFKI